LVELLIKQIFLKSSTKNKGGVAMKSSDFVGGTKKSFIEALHEGFALLSWPARKIMDAWDWFTDLAGWS
jgi:hypothetical protein